MAIVTTAPGCVLLFTPATAHMIDVLRKIAAPAPFDLLYITAGTNGEHSGPHDPHYRGDALDIRTHNFPTRADRYAFCEALQIMLTRGFNCFVEDPDQPNEHIHVQVAKGKTYPPAPINGGAPRTV